jgi:hypothetical protein
MEIRKWLEKRSEWNKFWHSEGTNYIYNDRTTSTNHTYLYAKEPSSYIFWNKFVLHHQTEGETRVRKTDKIVLKYEKFRKREKNYIQ